MSRWGVIERVGLAAGLLVIASLVSAKESERPKDSASKRSIEEIIVTAQRKEESAQDVAISMTVFSQEQIANANIVNAGDLANYTPSLSTNTRFGDEMTSYSIRGFTQDLRTTASVAVYFAEVVAPRGQQAQTSGDGAGPGSFFDLQNVQVLKGPQGTLFGRNTTGGSVLIVPAIPEEEFGGFVEFSRGDFDMSRKQAVINLPVSDTFKARFGIDQQQRDGHLHNASQIGARRLGNVNYSAARLSLLWDITEDIENYTIFTYADSDTHGYTSKLLACNENPEVGLGIVIGLLTGPGCQAQMAEQRAAGHVGHYDLVSTIATPVTTIDEKRVINRISWNLSENLTLKNILAYAHLESKYASDIFGTAFQAAYDLNPDREFTIGVSVVAPGEPQASQETWVEEVQLQGLALGGRLEYQTGLYYEYSGPDGVSGYRQTGIISCDLGTIEGDAARFNCFDPSNGTLGSIITGEFETEFINKAAYLQASYDIFEPLTATLGIRYTDDTTEGKGVKTRDSFAGTLRQDPIITRSNPKEHSRAPTGLAEVDYRPFDDVMLYVKYVRGYRQGSVNMMADPGLDSHEPETVDSYEAGAKTSFWGVVPGRFNISFFENTLTDMQLQAGYISSTAGPTTSINNAGKAEIKGFEIETFFQLVDSLSLGISYSKLDTELLELGTVDPQKIRDAVTAASGDPVAGEVSASTFVPIADVGDELPYAPESSWVATLRYDVPVPVSLGRISLGLTYVFVGEQRAAASSASPYSVLPEYELLNLNASWTEIAKSSVDFAVFATNVLDEEYLTYISGTYNVLGFDSAMVGQPRMVGARLRCNF